ncbi:MAG: hypothetical protein AB4426_14600, partial [Xenococcaceae cyanobacterium]
PDRLSDFEFYVWQLSLYVYQTNSSRPRAFCACPGVKIAYRHPQFAVAVGAEQGRQPRRCVADRHPPRCEPQFAIATPQLRTVSLVAQVLPQNEPSPGKGQIPITSLDGEPFIMREKGSGTRANASNFF